MQMEMLRRKFIFVSTFLVFLSCVSLHAIIREDAIFFDTVNIRKEFFFGDTSWKNRNSFQCFQGTNEKKVGVIFERKKSGGYDLMFFPAYRGEKDDKTYGKISFSFSQQDKVEKVRFYYLENSGCYIEFLQDSIQDKQHFDVYLFGQQCESNIEFNFNIDKLKFLPTHEILSAVNRYYPIESLLASQKNDDKIKGCLIEKVIKKAFSNYANDGALNEEGEFVFINTLAPMPKEKEGLNCSGFAKEIYDCYLHVINPHHSRLPIKILKEKHIDEENAFRQQHRQHEDTDPFFGKDWIENLNTQFNQLSGIVSQKAEELTKNDYAPYFDARGFRFSDLPYILFREQQKDPLFFYVAVFNKYRDNKRLIPEYYHISILVPYTKGKHFYVRVFESGEETSFDNLINHHVPREIPESVRNNILEHRLEKGSSSYDLMKLSYLPVNKARTFRIKKDISSEDKIRLARMLSDAEYEEEKVLIYKVPISYHFFYN